MKKAPHWISKKVLLLLHEESLSMFGGARGLRDEGLLDSALGRPQNRLVYDSASMIAELAASYAFGIAKNHAFVDGNKRAAFLSIGVFLSSNGYALEAGQVDAIQTILALASGSLDEPGLAVWIKANMARIR